jgi:hypothetical protein
MAHTFKRREKRTRPHTPLTTKPSTYAAEVKRMVQAPSDVVVLAESKRDHKLDPVHLPNTTIARAFSKEAEKYLVENPNALFKPKRDDAPAAPSDATSAPAKASRWTKKHTRAPSEFSKRIAACMADKGMSQAAVALGIGIKPTSVWAMLNPKVGDVQKPRPTTLAKLAEVLGVNADWLLHGTGERVAPTVVAATPQPTTPPPATPQPTTPTANVSAERARPGSTTPSLSVGDRRLLTALAESQAAAAEMLDSFGLTQTASMTRLAAEMIRRAVADSKKPNDQT